MADLTTTTSNTPWSAPYLQQFWNAAFQNANRPYQQYQGPQVAGLSDLQTGALGGIQGAMYGNPTTWAGMGLLGNVIDNKGNPYLDQATQTIKDDAGKAFSEQIGQLNSQFMNPNSFGSNQHQVAADNLTQAATRGLTQALGNLQYGQYNTGLDRGMAAANQAQGMSNSQFAQMMQGLQAGGVPQQLQQRIYDQGQTNFNNWWNYPTQQLGVLQGALGLGGNFGNQQTTMPGPNTASQVLGGGLMALGGLNSTGAFGNNGWLSGMFGGSSTPDAWNAALNNYGAGSALGGYGEGYGPW